jgi:nitroreductase
MEFQEVVRRRRMVRSYDLSRPVPPEVVDRILHNALRAPSAGFSQGFGFLVLDTPGDIARFRDAARPEADADDWFSSNVEAPLLVVPHANKSVYLDRYAEPDKGFEDRSDAWWPSPYWDIDTGFASLLMLLTAVDAGLGACFFGIPRDRIDAFRAVFGVPEEFRPIGAISIGYPDEADVDLDRLRSRIDARRRSEADTIHRGLRHRAERRAHDAHPREAGPGPPGR